eukprot:m.146834 g.146834  ORF g.146834 m.146834 type:complete len:234 (-) comp16096_c1_seq1:1127-1828(-)
MIRLRSCLLFRCKVQVTVIPWLIPILTLDHFAVTDEQAYAVLPAVPPLATFIITLVAMLPCLLSLLLRRTSPRRLYEAVVLCGLSSFLFGWHVHEKAILLALIPLSVIAFTHQRLARAHIVLQVAGGYALLPLIFTQNEALLKTTLFVASIMLVIYLHTFYTANKQVRFPLTIVERLYCLGFVPLHAFVSLHTFLLGDRLPFLPLMMISVYCAIGVVHTFILVYAHFLGQEDN